MANVFIIAEVLGIGFIFIAMMLLIRTDSGTKEQKLISYFLCGALIQNVGYLLELTASGLDAAVLAIKIQYLGSISVPLCYCWFIYSYCGAKPPRRLLNVIGAIDLGLLTMIFSLDWHKLYYRGMEWLVTADGHHYLSLTYGPAYPVFLIFGCVMPYFLTFYTLFRAVVTRPDYAGSRKYKTIMALSALPILALLSYAGKLMQVFDLTPFVLGVVMSLVVILVWRRQTYDFRRMAAEVLLENIGDGVIALDMEMRILSYNPAAVNIFPELASRRPGDSIVDIPQFHKDMFAEESNQEFCFCLREHYYESHSKMIVDREGKSQGYVVLILDVTDTRNYIEEIKRVREQAEQANTAKSEFLANMSHEIRTPMNAIIGLSDIIMEESVGRKLYTYAADIRSASQNLLAIINDILDLSKVEAGKMELVQAAYYVKPMVTEVVHMMDIAASQHGLVMRSEWDEEIPCRYYGDQGRIKQILINLLNNAIKFTKEGYVKISVSGQPGATEEEELLSFCVEDTGCGIRKEDQEKIFENFKQVNSKRNRSVEGTGLGLSITRHLVQLMGGSISLESVYGKGSVFTVTIPQKIVDRQTIAQMPDVAVAEKKKAEPFIANGVKALIVDDNLVNRKVARVFLAPYQFELSETDSGKGAIELVKQTKFDMIFMDHMMPEMDGIEAVQIIRKECGENGESPVIIALTANAMEGTRERFLNNGFQDFLSKPMDRGQLDDVLRRWVPEERRTEASEPAESDKEEPAPSAYDEIRIEGIDRRALEEKSSGTLEDYMELLQLYHLDGKRKTALLRQIYEAKDCKNYEIEVHGLKSASANVGAMKLSAKAKEHEEAASKGDWPYIVGLFPDLLASYETLLKNIERFLDERAKKGDSGGGSLPDIDGETVCRELEAALAQLESFHAKECAAGIEELLRHQLDERLRAKLKEVQEQLKLYEDERAEELLHQILEWLEKEER